MAQRRRLPPTLTIPRPYLSDPAHPDGQWSDPSTYVPVWNSVQPAFPDPGQNEGDFLTQQSRHYFAGPDAVDWTDVRECGKAPKIANDRMWKLIPDSFRSFV